MLKLLPLLLVPMCRPPSDDLAELRRAIIPLGPTQPSGSTKEFLPLIPLLKGVRIVGMGESTHGQREVFQMKHRMFRFLVEKLEFTVLALEASMAKCQAMDEYVLTGQGDPAAAVKAQGFWTWSTQEVLELILWMREYNQDPNHKRKLRVVGVDMQDRDGCYDRMVEILKKSGVKGALVEDPIWFPLFRHSQGKERAIQELERIVKSALPMVERQLGKEQARLVGYLITVFKQAYALETREVQVDDFFGAREEAMPVLKQVADRIAVLQEDAKHLPLESQYALTLLAKPTGEKIDAAKVVKAIQQITAFSAGRDILKADYDALLKVLEFLRMTTVQVEIMRTNPRDVYMADNAKWIIDSYLPGQKAMLWAHNYHVARLPKGQLETCGRELTTRMGNRFFPVGFAFGSGSFQSVAPKEVRGIPTEFTVEESTGGTLDRLLAAVCQEPFFISTAIPSLSRDLTTRNIGSRYDTATPAQYLQPINPATFYRAIIFIPKTTRAHPLSQNSEWTSSQPSKSNTTPDSPCLPMPSASALTTFGPRPILKSTMATGSSTAHIGE